MNKPVGIIDMDMTIADTNTRMIERLNQYFDLELKQSKVFDYFGDHEILTSLVTQKQQEEVFSRDSFFLSLDPIDGAQVALERLGYNFDIYIVTAPWMSAKRPYMDKYEWLEKHFPQLANKIIPTAHKQMIYGDFMVDDHIPFCKKWKKHHPYGIVVSLEYPWTNRNVVDIVAPNWNILARKIERKFGF